MIVVGGPDVDHRNPNDFLTRYPHYDYVVYGDGEDSFVKFIDAVLDNDLSDQRLHSIPNLIFRDSKHSVVKNAFVIYRGELYTEHSPWLHCREQFARDCDLVKSMNMQPYAAWDSDRGCPYDCSFCDWTAGGLYHKITKRKYDFRDEIQLFADNGATMSVTNANFGIVSRDLEIAEFIFEKIGCGQYPGFNFPGLNMAKLNKDRVEQILRLQTKYLNNIIITMAIQSMSEEVLSNIGRPSVPWEDQKKIIFSLREEGHVVNPNIEMIVGLPGETRESWDYAMGEILDLYPIGELRAHSWHILPGSPGARPEYQEKHGVKVYPSLVVSATRQGGVIDISRVNGILTLSQEAHSTQLVADPTAHGDYLTEEEILRLIKQESLATNGMFFVDELVWGSHNSDIEDVLYQLMSAGVVELLLRKGYNAAISKKMYHSLKDRMWKRACQDADWFRKCQEITGCVPNWIQHNGKIYMYQLAFTDPNVGLKLLS